MALKQNKPKQKKKKKLITMSPAQASLFGPNPKPSYEEKITEKRSYLLKSIDSIPENIKIRYWVF